MFEEYDKKFEDINIKLMDMDIIEILKNSTTTNLTTTNTTTTNSTSNNKLSVNNKTELNKSSKKMNVVENSPKINTNSSEFLILIKNLENKINKKFELIEKREGKVGSDEITNLQKEIGKIKESIETINKQEDFFKEKQTKYKIYMDKIKESSDTKLDKLRAYCEETYKLKPNLKIFEDNVEVENKELGAEELFLMEVKKKLREYEKQIKNL